MSNDPAGLVRISCEDDIITVRKVVRDLAQAIGFGLTDVTRIVTAASELTRNVYVYAGSGVMHWRELNLSDVPGLELTFVDQGPGIPDVGQAMEPGFSTRGGLGLGLPGAKRLMDELIIVSEVGGGTTVTVKKWQRQRRGNLGSSRPLQADSQSTA